MNKKILFISLLLSFTFSIATISFAQEGKMIRSLKEDVEIMETVLDKMFSSEKYFIPTIASNSRGFYLKDYGVIFHVRSSLPVSDVQVIMMKKLEKQLQTYTMKATRDKSDDSDIDLTEKMKKIREKISDFLGNYASSLRNLKTDERVAVVMDINNSLLNMDWYDKEIPQQIVASVLVKDLQKYRRGLINEADFRKRIDFKEVNEPAEDISIFTNVIKTAMEHSGRKNSFRISGDVQGIRFPGHGVLFITSFDLINSNADIIRFENFLRKKQDSKVIISQKEAPDYKQQVEALESKFIDLLSNYGHTLRNLNNDDWIEFAINFRDGSQETGFSRGIIKVRKRMIDDFNRNKINLKQFRKAVKVIYY